MHILSVFDRKYHAFFVSTARLFINKYLPRINTTNIFDTYLRLNFYVILRFIFAIKVTVQRECQTKMYIKIKNYRMRYKIKVAIETL